MHQRNIYLSNTHKNTFHKYSYDQQTGKYFLEIPGAKKTEVYKNGRIINKFIPHGSGFFSSKQRYQQSLNDLSALHYVPDSKLNKNHSLYTPITQKFMGYAQFPYKNQQKALPEHLTFSLQKTQNLINSRKLQQKKPFLLSKYTKSGNLIQKNGTEKIDDISFFENSMTSMIKSKPFPRKMKNTCYNNKCRLFESVIAYKQKLNLANNTTDVDKSLRSTFIETKDYIKNRVTPSKSFNMP